MPITSEQKAVAEQQQQHAAIDPAPSVRLIAGPGTGKSGTIIKRVVHLLEEEVVPGNLYVISFTRAACEELRGRVAQACAANHPEAAGQIRVSTMHSLALTILRRANLLTAYPADPILLDDWEQKEIYDIELSAVLGCPPTRAGQIRVAHDAAWQTLNSAEIDQAQIKPAEKDGFTAFHSARTHLYSCVLPGEVVYRCVKAIQENAIDASQLPQIDYLIVDEYQDLNACDQRFIQLLTAKTGARLFVAGDDDQSIYSFRHANPAGIVEFEATYPDASTHVLTDCFRCAPAVLAGATTLIQHNPNRVQKSLKALYGNAVPPVQGRLAVWSFADAVSEARAIASSCTALIKAGLAGREDEIVILISNRKAQLDVLAQELGNSGLPYSSPSGEDVTDLPGVRAGYCLLRIMNDHENGKPDYPAHRALLSLLSGVGPATAKDLADRCVTNAQNFHDLFYEEKSLGWLTGRIASAADRIRACATAACSWKLSDTLAERAAEMEAVLRSHVFVSGNQVGNHLGAWTGLVSSLPGDITLGEMFQFLGAPSEEDQQAILSAVHQRLGTSEPAASPGKKIRILTMHGAKGLNGKIVFIPSLEQGILPSFRALHATGLLIEQRRLFYVSLTRAMACCIVSHATLHTGTVAFLLQQRPTVRLPRSQFLSEMGLASENRQQGLSAAEAAAILGDVGNL